jgi:hypothetical protein
VKLDASPDPAHTPSTRTDVVAPPNPPARRAESLRQYREAKRLVNADALEAWLETRTSSQRRNG